MASRKTALFVDDSMSTGRIVSSILESICPDIQSTVQARAADCGYQFIPKPVIEQNLTESVAIAEGD